jgi:hypothetical protein
MDSSAGFHGASGKVSWFRIIANFPVGVVIE